MSTLADRLNKKMEELGKTQSDIARAIGVSPTAITKITSGETKRSRYLGDIAKTLGVTESWLLFGIEPNAKRIDASVKSWDKNTLIPEGMIAVPYFKDIRTDNTHALHYGSLKRF